MYLCCLQKEARRQRAVRCGARALPQHGAATGAPSRGRTRRQALPARGSAGAQPGGWGGAAPPRAGTAQRAAAAGLRPRRESAGGWGQAGQGAPRRPRCRGEGKEPSGSRARLARRQRSAAQRQVLHRAQGQPRGLLAPRRACGNGIQRRAGEGPRPPEMCVLATGPIACEDHGDPRPLHNGAGGVQRQDPLCLCRELPLLSPRRSGTGGNWHSSHFGGRNSEKVPLGSYVHSLLFPYKFIIFHLVLRRVPY